MTRAAASTFRPTQLPIDASALALGPDPCHCVAVAELENRYNVLRAEEHARKEGMCGPQWSTEVAESKHNAGRNRYPSVVPWDHSRVLLPVNKGENDYINASWVELGSRTYIATQGPLPSTVGDFWQMVYAYGGEPAIIIMLTPLYEHAVEKCAKYWPDSKQVPLVHKDKAYRFNLTVSLEKQHTKNEQYKLTTFKLTPSDPKFAPRTVHHIYYHTWMDLTKPNADADLRALIHLVNNRLRNPASPPIVHCSAGIGRTGTFIAIDALLSRIDIDINPAIQPRIVPMWRCDTSTLQFRNSLFTGQVDELAGGGSGHSPVLSRFDVSKASSIVSMTASSTAANSPAPRSPPGLDSDENGFLDAQEVSSTTPTLGTVNPHHPHSRASAVKALQESTNGDHKDFDVDDLHTDECEAPQKSSAKSGPAIKKVAVSVTSVEPEVFSETPETVDVLQWFNNEDPVMSTIRTMRKQRPKMVQGKQQLGYIYDQFEVGQQLARVTPNNVHELRRRSTAMKLHVESSTRSPVAIKPRKIFSFSLGSRRASQSSAASDASSHNSASSHKSKIKSLFSSSILR